MIRRIDVGPRASKRELFSVEPSTLGGPTWTSPARLYLDKQGNVVGAKDPTKHTLLVAAGGEIPLRRAKALGLVGTEAAPSGSPDDMEAS